MNTSCLPLLVAQHLSHEPCSGYTLVKHIQIETGWKPSYGSVYPLLKGMEHDGLISVKPEGRRKLYTLTAKGYEHFKEQKTLREQAFKNIIEQLHILASLGETEASMLADALEAKKIDGFPLKNIPEAVQMRAEVFRIVTQGRAEQNRHKLKEIFGKTVKELQTL